MLKNRNTWFYAFIVAAVLLVAAAVAIVVISGNQPETPVQVETPVEPGPETGVYYYGVEQGEIILSLNNGNKFTIAGPGINRSGTYTVDGQNVAFTFVQGSDVATAVLGTDVVTMTYNGNVMTFLKQTNYTVTFDTDGGEQLAAVTVLNGKQVAAPANPSKDGYVFIGWYADADCKTPYQFTSAVTGDVTVYAGWIKKEAGRVEYVAHFELGYDGAEELADMTTINGKLFGMPVPTRDGYTFGGWYVSMSEDGQKLTYAYDAEEVLSADTTLYAVWNKKEGSKLIAPNVSVTATGIRWNVVDGASAYLVKILDSQGGVLHEETMGATTMNFDFGSRAAGDYTVEITAIANNTANNSDVTVRYFRNKALDRVTKFQVINGMLIFNAVENAQNYLITIDCGNDEHNHTRHNNGSSTVYNFANCQMQEGGIRFTVVATANGYMESIPQTFVYDRSLNAVENLIYDAANDRFLWDVVENATAYMITLTVGETTIEINNGTSNSFSTAFYSGNISISVTPVTEGYNTPAAATANCTKTAPAAPQNIRLDNMVITWDPVAGAEKYEVKVGSVSYEVTETRLDLIAQKFDASIGESYQIQVKAIAGAEGSAYSTVVSLYKTMDPEMSYSNNTVFWTPVLGCTNFDVRVNGGEAFRVTNTNSAKVVLTKAGTNIIEVRCSDLSSGEWVSIEVTAYEVVYNSRTLGGEMREYLAVGDKMMMPQHFTNEGYDFAGWYNAPGAANGNGKPYSTDVFTGNGDTTLYANWSPKDYRIYFVVDGSVSNIVNDSYEYVTYTKNFTLTPAITNDTSLGYFVGWYTGPNGTGIQITDSEGNSVAPYNVTDKSYVYPYFADSLTYELLEDGTYGVRKGPGINNKSVRNLYIPATYQGKPVTQILDSAFARINNILTVEIPDTVTRIGVAAFERCDNLTAFTVYQADPNSTYEVFYASDNGALLYMDAASGNTYLELFPAAKTGTYTVPENVDNIRPYAFQNSNLEKVIISKNVTLVAENAFYNCTRMRTIEFEFNRTETLTIEDGAFVGLYRVETLILPAKLAAINDLKMLDRLTGLKTITVEKGGDHYSSLDNLLCDALGTSLLYVPNSFAGVFEVPSGITTIGPSTFSGRKSITEVIIPAYVNEIGTSAFAGCTGLTKLTINGPRNNDLVIKNNAFAYCSDLLEVIFDGGDTAIGGGGKITIADQAFYNCEELEKLVIGDGVIIPSIGTRAFADCVMLNEMNIHDNATITSIGNQAFQNCDSIKEYVVHASTTNVGNSAFSGCSYLETVRFAPNGQQVTFGTGVFSNCDRLTTIQLPATLSAFDGSVFDGCEHIYNVEVDPNNQHLETYKNALYTKGLTELIYYPRNLDGDLTQLPWDTLTKIGPAVFKGNAKITSVVIGAKVTEISNNAFDTCINLASVTFANKDSAMVIGNNAFNGCSSLTEVVLPTGTTSIGNKAFFLTKLSTITIPAGVTRIGDMAFAFTDIASVHFPAAVSYIGAAAFYGVDDLTTVTFEGGKEPLTLGGSSASGTNIKNAGVFYGTALTEVVLPANIASIGNYVFAELAGLTSVTVPAEAQLTYIGSYAFYKTNITAITLPDGLKTIGENAFRGTKLTTVTIPASVETINAYALSTNTLTQILFGEGTPSEKGLTIKDHAFVGTAISEITLPAHLKEIGSFNNSYYYQTVEDVFYKNSKTTTATSDLTDNTHLTKINVAEGGQYFASRDGVLYAVENGELVTALYCPRGNSGVNGEIRIPNTVTRVQLSAFCETQVTTVIFEEFAKDDPRYGTGLLTIGDFIGTAAGESTAFGTQRSGQYSKLKLIQFPSHLKAVHSNAIRGLNYANNAEKDAVIIFSPDSTVAFEAAAIRNNNAIKVIQMPKLTKTERLCFTQNSNLESVTFAPGSNMTTMGERAFEGCAKLTSIVIPASVTMLGKGCFSGCRALASFSQEEGGKLETIGEQAFSSCTSFKVFKVPDSVTVIDTNAFSGCTLLYRIELSASMRNPVPTKGSIGSGCASLVEVVVPDDHEYLKSVDGVLYDKQMTVLYLYPANKGPLAEPIPDSVQIIEGGAFYGYQGATIKMPANLMYIRNCAFTDSKLEYITLPKKLREIGEEAFRNSQKLHTVNFEEGSEMELIEPRAFNSCSALANIVLPDRIHTIGKNAFEGCRSLKKIVLPAALRKIATYTFKSSGLEEIVMQEGLVEIETRAFESCKSLVSVTIPDTVTKLGEFVFYSSTALEEVIMSEFSICQEVGQNLFHTCTALKTVHFGPRINVFGKTLFNKCYAMEEVLLPDDLTEVPASLFMDCEYLRRVTIPAKATKIGDDAFKNCVSLESVMIPANVKTIGQNAFSGCTNLASVEIESGNTMQIISPNAFYNCVALVSINLPQTVVEYGDMCFANTGITSAPISTATRKIGNYAFYNCLGLTGLSIPSSVTNIGDFAFAGCSNVRSLALATGLKNIGDFAFSDMVLIEGVTIPETVAFMGDNPFTNCVNLTNLVLDSANESFIMDDRGAILDKTGYTLIYYPVYKTEATYVIPETVYEIAGGAFSGSQLQSIVIPETIKAIPVSAFRNSQKLESVVIPGSVTTIAANAFQDCVLLNNVVIPASVQSMGDYSFAGCASLNSVTFEDRKVALTLGIHLFDGCTAMTKLVDIPGLTAFTDYMYANTGIVDLVIPVTITDVSRPGVFAGCVNLQSIRFPAGISGHLGGRFFYGCTALESVEIPGTISDLGTNGVNTIDVKIPSVGETFANCTNLKTVTFNGRISCLVGAFENCTSLTTVVLPESVSDFQVGERMFYGCISLNDVTFLSKASTIEKEAFMGCTSIVGEITLFSRLQCVGDDAFSGCVNITRINVMGMEEPRTYSFRGLTANTTVYFRGFTSEESMINRYGQGNTEFLRNTEAIIEFAKDPGNNKIDYSLTEEEQKKLEEFIGNYGLPKEFMAEIEAKWVAYKTAFCEVEPADELSKEEMEQLIQFLEGNKIDGKEAEIFAKQWVEYKKQLAKELSESAFNLTEEEMKQLQQFVEENKLSKDAFTLIRNAWVGYKKSFNETNPADELSKEEMEQLRMFCEEKLGLKDWERLAKQWVEYKKQLAESNKPKDKYVSEAEKEEFKMMFGKFGVPESLLDLFVQKLNEYKVNFNEKEPGKELSKEDIVALEEFLNTLNLDKEAYARLNEDLQRRWVELKFKLAEGLKKGELTKEDDEYLNRLMELGVGKEMIEEIRARLVLYKRFFEETIPVKELTDAEKAELKAFMAEFGISDDEKTFAMMCEQWVEYKNMLIKS